MHISIINGAFRHVLINSCIVTDVFYAALVGISEGLVVLDEVALTGNVTD